MKYVKMLGLAAVAAAALMAFVGAGTASATELFKGTEKMGVGSTLEGSLKSGTSALLSTTDENTIVDTCTKATVAGKVTNAGGIFENEKEEKITTDVSGEITALGWGEKADCSFTTDTLTNGNLSISGTTEPNGTVSGTSSVVTVNIGVSCRYGTGTGTTLGTATGTTDTSKHAEIDINAIINEQEPKQFLCPDTTRWKATYVVTSPTGLNVK
jgi:hypothetical protein